MMKGEIKIELNIPKPNAKQIEFFKAKAIRIAYEGRGAEVKAGLQGLRPFY